MKNTKKSKRIFKRRKLNVSHYLVLLILFALALWLNIRLLSVDSIECNSIGSGVCTEVTSYTISSYIAYLAIIIFALYALYLYIIKQGKRMVEQEITEETKEQTEVKTEVKEIKTEVKTEVKEIKVPQEKIPVVVAKTTKATVKKEKVIVRYKKDVIEDVVSNTSLTSYQSAKVINTIFEEITNELVKGNIVSIEEFGRFKKYRVEDHAGVNPGTGESIVIEAHNRINFTPSKELKDSFKGQIPNFKKKEYVTNEAKIEQLQEAKEPTVKPIKEKAKKPAIISKTKTDIVAAIMAATGLSKAKSSLFLNTMLDEVTSDIIEGNTVSLDGVGTLKKYRVEDHAGINPGTGESIVIEGHNRIKYVPSKDLKSKLNE